ncbi:hypothetical protein J5N97_005935 [Dioscorea zingiberensis]|uniref:AP180 N-terminal homology (ANTH) domain-containing protein n=1 Tax=Dioscorea zingiberensis TaxID=325984 RepID=A0A9D5DAP1_9LILI|nr:hypothetical protein J5N97_005935 [Dioscorea zingiberensis]
MPRIFGQACCAAVPSPVSLRHLLAKTTGPDNIPLPESTIYEIVNILADSPASTHNFILSFTSRFGRARSARVAIKCLMLLHRLLRALPTPHPFRANLLHSRANAFISLSPCNFRSASYEITVFVHSYARLIDHALSLDHAALTAASITSSSNFVERIKEAESALEVIPQLQDLLDRVMECEPTGAAPLNYVTRLAMEQIARESFACYAAVWRELPVMLDNLLRMRHQGCVAGLGVYRRAADQARRLTKFYEWCRRTRLCAVYEYPHVEKIPRIQVRALESLVAGLWQLTDSSSSSSSSASVSPVTTVSSVSTPVMLAEAMKRIGVDEEPLIRLEEDEGGWEELLEASVEHLSSKWSLPGAWKRSDDDSGMEKDGWRLPVCDSSSFVNPFSECGKL